VDESVKLWGETEDRLESKHTYTGHTLGVVSVAVEATGTYAASSALDSFIRVWSLKDSSTKAIIETQPSETWQITFAPAGDQLQVAAAGAVHAPNHQVCHAAMHFVSATGQLHG
jgi:WD repeat-containing protein 61